MLDIQLTQHGKRLLSEGKFKPVFYAFFDDNILYDSEYGGFEEDRNEAGERIRKDTPSLEVQYAFSGIETDIKKAIRAKRDRIKEGYDDVPMIQGTPEKHFSIAAPLGNSSIGEESIPAWQVTMLEGEISGAVNVEVTGSQPYFRIPQINLFDTFYKTSVKKDEFFIASTTGRGTSNLVEAEEELGEEFELDFSSQRFEDGTFISIESDFLLIQVDEANADILTNNFDIEMFIEEEDPITEQRIYTPLRFEASRPLVVDNILVDADDSIPLENRELDPTYVSHFFNVFVDNEIDSDILCDLAPAEVLEASFPANSFDCEERKVEIINADGLYETDVHADDIEDC